MNSNYVLKLVAPAALLGLVLSMPAFAAEADTASESASSEMQEAGHDTANAISNSYHGVKRAVKDTQITARVKTEMHEDRVLSKADIHVSTKAGVVTLSGDVPSPVMVRAAEEVAARTVGVKKVNNKLMVASRSAEAPAKSN